MFIDSVTILRKLRDDTRGVAAIEFALCASFMAVGLLNAVDVGFYAYRRMEVENAAQAGAQAAWKTCYDQRSMLPATQNCSGLNNAITTAIQATNLGKGVSLAAGYPIEGYYCANASNILQAVGDLSNKPGNCSAAGELEHDTRRLYSSRRDLYIRTDVQGHYRDERMGHHFDHDDELDAVGLAMTGTKRVRLWRCERGSTAVEFAIILPALAMLIIGIISACLLVLSAASLHYAVEQAARCYSVSASQCGSTSDTQTYAQNYYRGMSTPTFIASTPACGHQVSATVTIVLNAAVSAWSVPLSATACFP